MKRAVLIAVVFAVFLPLGGASTITDVGVSKQQPWTDDAFDITTTCTPENQTHQVVLENVTRDRVDGRTVWAPGTDLSFTANPDVEGEYFLRTEKVKDYINARGSFGPGDYRFAVRCGAGNASDAAFGNVTVRRLVASLEEGLGGTYYTDETAKALVEVRVEAFGSTPVWAGDVERPTFWVDWGDGREALPYWFDAERKYWALNVSMPAQTGDRAAALVAAYDGAETSDTTTVTVEEPLSFDVSASPLEVGAGDTVTLDVAATHRGDQLTVGKEDVSVTVDGSTVTGLTAETVAEGASRFTFPAPDLDPGAYQLGVDLSGYSASATRTLRYPIMVEGRFEDRNGQGVRHALRFRDGQRTVMELSGRGDYAGSVLPGTYDVEAVFENGRAAARFSDVDVEAWDDPLRYARYEGGVPGLRVAGLYAFRAGMDFDAVDLTLEYDEAAVDNPDGLAVFRCDGWNMGDGTCYTGWSEVAADFDAVQAEARVSSASLSAFAVGRRDGLRVLHGHEKEAYLPDGAVSFGGMVQDGAGNPVQNASVTLDLAPAGMTRTVTTDAQGRYTFTVPAPDAAGTYTAELTAAKAPYADGGAAFTFDVERPPRLEVTAPDSVTLRQNSSKRMDVFVKNTGYAAIDDIQAGTEDIPFLERVAYNRASLERNESRRVTVSLAAGPNATPGTHTAKIRFTYADDAAVEHVFGVTVEAVETASGSQTTLTGNLPVSGVSAALADASPAGVPVTTVVFVVLLLQGGIVAFFFLRTRIGVDRPVIGTVSTVRDDISAPGLFGGGEPERENVLRAVDHIKEELDR